MFVILLYERTMSSPTVCKGIALLGVHRRYVTLKVAAYQDLYREA